MTKLFTAFALIVFIHLNSKAAVVYNELETESAFAIDSTDTVYFDLSKAVISGNQLILPVGIMTGQPINSLDFSLKYDHNELDYDTMFNLTTYLQGMSYYNPADSTVRYTSSSFQAIGVGVNLVNVQFNLLGLQINNADFNDVKGYLNGIKCTAIILNQLSVGVAEHSAIKELQIYPNPASDIITVSNKQEADFYITDMQGRIVSEIIHLNAGEKQIISLAGLNNGMYLLQSAAIDNYNCRFIVQH